MIEKETFTVVGFKMALFEISLWKPIVKKKTKQNKTTDETMEEFSLLSDFAFTIIKYITLFENRMANNQENININSL